MGFLGTKSSKVIQKLTCLSFIKGQEKDKISALSTL